MSNDLEDVYIECPYCNIRIMILSFNCCIYRCGVYKNNGIQIPPHSSKEICDELTTKDLIYGCGKPFRLIVNNGTILSIEKCEYI